MRSESRRPRSMSFSEFGPGAIDFFLARRRLDDAVDGVEHAFARLVDRVGLVQNRAEQNDPRLVELQRPVPRPASPSSCRRGPCTAGPTAPRPARRRAPRSRRCRDGRRQGRDTRRGSPARRRRACTMVVRSPSCTGSTVWVGARVRAGRGICRRGRSPARRSSARRPCRPPSARRCRVGSTCDRTPAGCRSARSSTSDRLPITGRP